VGRLVRDMGRVIPKPVLDAAAEAGRVLDAARAEADGIRAGARSAREAARIEGFEEGRNAARAEAVEILVAARADAEQVRADARDMAVALAVRMAEKIVGRVVELAPAILADIAAQALAASRARDGVITVRVHPADLAAVAVARPGLTDRLAGRAELRLISDETVGRFGCVVESRAGRLDGRLMTQLAALERALVNREDGGGRG